MLPDALWTRYAAIWSLDADARVAEMTACLADDVTYCDPNGLIEDHPALSAYMGDFQHAVPGGRFRIRAVRHHHGRTLADWTLHGPDGSSIQAGTSFRLLSDDGRLRAITGFFHSADPT